MDGCTTQELEAVIGEAISDIESTFYDIESMQNDLRDMGYELGDLKKKLQDVRTRLDRLKHCLNDHPAGGENAQPVQEQSKHSFRL
jgi:archaellum component FlaC